MSAVTVVEEGVRVERRPGGLHAACFSAMASPCEVLVDTTSADLALEVGSRAAREAWRIEQRYSRYRPDSVLSALNASNGSPVAMDTETTALLDYARQCHFVSDGWFDITSGVLRRAWRFDGSHNIPDAALITQLLDRVGFEKLSLDERNLIVPTGMELDLGGIGKEYAVDRALMLATMDTNASVLVNFGGDLACRGVPQSGPWQIGVESPGAHANAAMVLELASSGGLATSGDTHRFVLHEGRRLGHILNPRTGWPVEGGPASVTVAAGTCLEAGTLATFALLKGPDAESFLQEQGVRYWALWPERTN